MSGVQPLPAWQAAAIQDGQTYCSGPLKQVLEIFLDVFLWSYEISLLWVLVGHRLGFLDHTLLGLFYANCISHCLRPMIRLCRFRLPEFILHNWSCVGLPSCKERRSSLSRWICRLGMHRIFVTRVLERIISSFMPFFITDLFTLIL